MSAAEKSSVEPKVKSDIKRLGVIAGGGSIPEKLLHACDKSGQEVFVIGFDGQTDPKIMNDRKFMMTRLGAAGQIISTLKSHDVTDLVLIGSIKRPSLAELKPDMRTAQFFAKIGLKALGDDGLLTAMRAELEQEGFVIHGAHNFVENLLAGTGPVGKYKPKKIDLVDIERGVEVSSKLGLLDVGQAVIVQEGIVLSVEGAEGTDEMIKRTKLYKRKGAGGVLIKTCKPQQDRDFDLPTIGPETIRLCALSGLAGVAIEAGSSLLIEPKEVAKIADEHKMFVIGLDMKDRRCA